MLKVTALHSYSACTQSTHPPSDIIVVTIVIIMVVIVAVLLAGKAYSRCAFGSLSTRSRIILSTVISTLLSGCCIASASCLFTATCPSDSDCIENTPIFQGLYSCSIRLFPSPSVPTGIAVSVVCNGAIASKGHKRTWLARPRILVLKDVTSRRPKGNCRRQGQSFFSSSLSSSNLQRPDRSSAARRSRKACSRRSCWYGFFGVGSFSM